MAMGDPFGTTAELAYKSGSSLGEGILSAAGMYAKKRQQQMENQQKKEDLLSTLASKGIYLKGTGETFKIEGVGEFDKPKKFNFSEVMDILNKNQEVDNALGVTGATLDPETGDVKLNFGQTPDSKSSQEAKTSRIKEREVAIGKAERLNTVGESSKKQWLKTSPYGGAITRTGLVPILGQWDILKKGLGATSSQRQDQVYSDFVQGIRAQLARGMGDVGNLSEYEQRAVIRLIPNLYDSLESGNLKLSQLAQLVDDIRSTRGKDMNSENKKQSKYTPEDLEYTAKIHNMSIEEVKKRLGI